MDADTAAIFGTPAAKAADVGFSASGLAAIEQTLGADVESGKIPGAITLIERHGQIAHCAMVGYRDGPAKVPLTLDTIFRIYSMTKPITSVALMMLVESGQVRLDDPVATYLPALGGLTVGIDRTPCETEMTVRHLLTHTSGLTYGVFEFSDIRKLYLAAGVDGRDISLAEMVNRLGELPLSTAPGTQWEYSRATDVLGRVIAVVAGMPFDRFLATRIFEPLDMIDTGFYVPKDHHRIAEPLNEPLMDVRAPVANLSGGGGLVSTMLDYLRFARVLLGGGRHGDVQLLAKHTFDEMVRDHIGSLAGTGPYYIPGRGYGFGLGFAVRTTADGWMSGSVGDFYWSGYGGTYFWIDPAKDMLAIFMAQCPEHRDHYRALIRNLVYAAMTD